MRFPKLFYGWWIVIGSTVAVMFASAFAYYGFGSFFPAVESEFGWSRTAISGAFSLGRAETGVLGPLGGFFVDRLGPQRIMVIGVLLIGGGFIMFSRVNSLLSFYLILIFGVTLGQSLGFHMPASASIANWFRRKRGMAFGIFRSGPGLAGLVVPVLGWFIVTQGWRQAALIAGLIMIVVGLPISRLMRHRPEDSGCTPDGEPVTPASTMATGSQDASLSQTFPISETSFTPLQAVRTSSFWLLAIATMLTMMATSGVFVHFVVMLDDRGINPALGSTLLGSVAVVSVLGRFGLTWFSDYVNKSLLQSGILVLLGLVVLGMGWAQSLWLFAPFTFLFAILYGGAISVKEPIQADYFGPRHFATVMGSLRLITAAGHVSGPVLAGLIYDSTQSYELAFELFGCGVLVGAVCMLLARPPKPPAPRKLPLPA
jgi:MFS family permease